MIFDPGGSADCVACHQATYQGAHAGSGYPTTCATCHTTSAWDGASADHAVLSDGFVLLGNHSLLTCERCHALPSLDPIFQPSTPEDCLACHQADYQREHSVSGYPTTCLTCHQVTTWSGATANHEALSGGFALLGNHGLLSCTSCHIVPGYQPLFSPTSPEDCLACHQADYQREHGGSGYPTVCLTCHQVTSWQGATFNHDGNFFPIYSGKHKGRWSACTNCHANPSDFGVFSCLNCHEHRKSAMDEKHRERSGYVYDSRNCLACHPTGNA